MAAISDTRLHSQRACDACSRIWCTSSTIEPVLPGALAARSAGTPGILAAVIGVGTLRADRRAWLGRVRRTLLRVSLAGRPQVVCHNPDLHALVAARIAPTCRAPSVAGSSVDTEAPTSPRRWHGSRSVDERDRASNHAARERMRLCH